MNSSWSNNLCILVKILMNLPCHLLLTENQYPIYWFAIFFLYRFHVLGDTTVPNPGFLPYYTPAFFDTIKKYQDDETYDVTTMSIRQWVQCLTEDGLTMQGTDPRTFRPCRAELSSPSTDWPLSWMICRLQGLGSELTTFNFKLLHKLLVSRERLHHLTPTSSPTCSHCSTENEDLEHALVSCNFNNNVGKNLLEIVKTHVPSITSTSLLSLELTSLPEDKLFPLTYFTSSILKMIWEKRLTKSRISSYDIRTILEANCIMLRKTGFQSQITILEELVIRL